MTGPTINDIPIVGIDRVNAATGMATRLLFDVIEVEYGLDIVPREDVSDYLLGVARAELERQECIWWEAQP